MTDSSFVFQGIRVLDFSWFVAGPLVTKVLADFGAQVIKVESNRKVDGIRLRPPVPAGKTGVNVSGYFNNVNSSKLSMSLNMNHPKARSIVGRLVAISDVVIDNFAPRVMEQWNFTYQDLVKIKPDLIVVNQPMFGLNGPHRDFVGFGANIAALAGLDYLMGFPNRMPVGTGIPYPDYSSNPYHTVVALLTALYHRRRTGKGQHIELSQVESTICTLETAILDFTVNKRIQERPGNHLTYAAPHSAYRCQGEDRWCVIAVFSDEEWQAFRRVVGELPWISDKKFATLLRRKENEQELDKLIEAWTIERTAEEVMAVMQWAGVAAGVVQDARDLLVHDPQMRAREHYVYLNHPEAGLTAYDGVPYKISASLGRPRSPAPLLGEHSEQVYREILGMSEEETNKYIVDGVFL